MKLCRFELRETPGEVKSGIVYNGRVYETDGTNAIAVHEAESIRPLPPIGQPPAIRLFRTDIPQLGEGEGFAYAYLNPTILSGASTLLRRPEFSTHISFLPCLGVVIGGEGADVPVESADEMILGYTLINLLVARDVERLEKEWRIGPGRSHDLGAVMGPVLVTPDELEESVIEEIPSKRYSLEVLVRINGVERLRSNLSELRPSFASLISSSSESSPLHQGEVFAVGPIAWPDDDQPVSISPSDEVHLVVESLGTLAMKIS